MKRSRVWISVVMIGAVIGLKAALVRADDPLKVAPTMYKLLFENNRIRVMEVTFKAGEKIAKHSHPDHMVYVVEGGKLKISKPDGTSGDNDLKQGQVVWIPAETHWAENTGMATVRLLVTELKEPAPMAMGSPSKKAKP